MSNSLKKKLPKTIPVLMEIEYCGETRDDDDPDVMMDAWGNRVGGKVLHGIEMYIAGAPSSIEGTLYFHGTEEEIEDLLSEITHNVNFNPVSHSTFRPGGRYEPFANRDGSPRFEYGKPRPDVIPLGYSPPSRFDKKETYRERVPIYQEDPSLTLESVVRDAFGEKLDPITATLASSIDEFFKI